MKTVIAKELKKLRISKGISINQIANSLEIEDLAMIAVESGKKIVNTKLFNDIVRFYNDDAITKVLTVALWKSHSSYVIKVKGHRQELREMVALFASSYHLLSNDDLVKIQKILTPKIG